MRTSLLLGLTVALVTGGVVGQPKDGDLIVCCSFTSMPVTPHVAYIDPTNSGSMRTLTIAPANLSFNLVRMAPDNSDLVITQVGQQFRIPNALVKLSTIGTISTLAVLALTSGNPWVMGYELDHDGKWVVAGYDQYDSHLLGVHHVSGRLTTFVWGDHRYFDDVAIDRDPGAMPYVLGTDNGLERANRNGLQGLIANLGSTTYSGLELHPRSGDYVLASLGQWVIRVRKSGAITTLVNHPGGAARITQDDHLWVGRNGLAGLLKYDLSGKAVVSIISLGKTVWADGIEIYGSRRLICNQVSNRVTVNVQSRHPLAFGASYILAASPARRPGIKFSNGEWLDLDVTHPLFYLTVQNLAPQVFVNFQGTLHQRGNNTKPISVNIPPGLPKMGNMTIFVGGVIYNGTNVVQVTNSHWFVLP